MKASSYLKKLFVVAALMLFTQLAQAQSYLKINYTIDSLLTLGLPKSALAEVDKLDAMARKDNNVPQQVHAAVYRMMFQSYVEENSLVAIITRLKTDIDKATYPVKPILQSIQADMYYNYYQQNRWQFTKRTRLEKPSADFTQWDLQTLIDETSRLYKASLHDATREQNTSLDVLDGALKGDINTRYLRPTLYDLLLHRALTFFLMDEPALTKPKMPFSINDARFFGDGKAFADLQVITSDTTSTWYLGIKLLQQATLYHIQKDDKEAQADLDITRVEFLYNKSSMANKDTLYVKALKNIASANAQKPISADALLVLGKYYQQKNDLKTALVYLHKAIADHPKSHGAINAAVVAAQIEQKTLSAAIESVNIPGIPLLASVNYRNIKQAKLTLYRVTARQLDEYLDAKIGYYDKAKKWKSMNDVLKNIKPVQQKILQLPDPQDYRDHRTEFKIDPLDAGNYLLRIEDMAAAADSSLIQMITVKVSRLAFMDRLNADNTTEMRVVDRQTGQPLNNVWVKAIGRNKSGSTGFTDKNGKYKPTFSDQGSATFTLALKGDTLEDGHGYISGSVYDPDDDKDKEDDKTILFTDRQIYRPGQTIYFKGLQLAIYKSKTSISNKDTVEVELQDANGKKQGSLSFKPNEFGTFAGKFVIPQNIFPGECRLTTDNSNVRIRIEEYKRPTFKAEFLPVKGSYKPNDTIKVKGKAMALSGYGLSQAQVAYHITRSIRRVTYGPYYGGFYDGGNTQATEIKLDTINTDAQGQFEIKFKAVPTDAANSNAVIYSYNITMDVTDAAGETHSANTVVRVSNNNIAIKSYLPSQIQPKDTGKVGVSLNNLNGQPLSGRVTIQVYALQNPDRVFKSRLWQEPDQYMLSKDEYKTAFPAYAYRGEDSPQKWQRLNEISNTTVNVTDTARAYFNLKQLTQQPGGLYRVVVSAQSLSGDTTSTIAYVRLIANKPMPVKITDWVTVDVNAVKPGDAANFMVGVDGPSIVLMEKYKGPKMVSSQWLQLDAGQRGIKVPTSKTDTDVAVQFMMVYQNRAYSSYQKIYLQRLENRLDIKFISHRDKLQPGEKEQWKLQVSSPGNEKQAAEMVASLYDASLDEISPAQSWVNAMEERQRYHGNYYNWTTYNFIQRDDTSPLVYKYHNYYEAPRNYEILDMMGYGYYGGYNYGFRNYLQQASRRLATSKSDVNIENSYAQNAALVKNGVDVLGKVVDGKGQLMPGVSITIKGTSIGTNTNSLGYFKIKVPINSTLRIAFIGFITREIAVTKAESMSLTLKENEHGLQEVVVVGYGSVEKRSMTASISTVTTVRMNGKDFTGPDLNTALAGRLAGVSINQYGDKGIRVQLRGSASGAVAKALIVVDGVPMDSDVLDLQPGDIESTTVLKDAQATAIYGARGANGVIIIVTKAAASMQPITIRKNFNETAFFYPQLRTDDKGQILIDFTIPEALTKWRFKAFAHTKDLKFGYMESEVLTQKQLSISAITPRFLREGDSITISARLVNLTTAPMQGKLKLQLFNAITMQPVNLLVNPADAEQNIDVAPSSNKPVSFKMFIPFGIDALTYRLTAAAGTFTDGEENTLPILPNRMLVTESMPMMVRGGQTRAFNLDRLINQNSTTLKNKTLTLEYTQNPAWYAVQALPYMMEFPYECSEQTFSRYYANSLGTSLVNKMPLIKQTFDQWRAANSTEMLSNLEKNQELKATLLEETPWLRDAANEAERKKRVALLFDLDKMNYELRTTLDKLKARQLPDGSFPWFGGDRGDEYITRHILAGMGQLYHLGIVDTKNETLKAIADKAMTYLDDALLRDAYFAKEHKTYEGRNLWSGEIHSYYTQSYFTARTMKPEVKALVANYLALAEKQWLNQGVYEQGLIALTMLRNGKADVAQKIIHSLTETAQITDDMGMYWASNKWGYFWYQSPIETQSLMIELFTEAGGQDKAVEEMKVWLLRNKQTNDWKTTKATAAACYALLLKGGNWLADNGTSEIKLDSKPLTEIKPGIKPEPGTGYIKTNWADEQVKPAMGKVSITNNGKTISWGALHWQYLENLDKIAPSNTDIHIERKYFIQKQTDRGTMLTTVDATHKPKPGDLLKVVVYLKAGRDYEYIQLKDMRPAGTEPVDALSRYKYQDGLYYYQVTKDVGTNFFISYLNKGSYVFEYQLRVAQPGNFSTGISTVQCMYAPEFNAHSEGARLSFGQ